CHPERRPNERSEFGQVEGPRVLSSRAPSKPAKLVRTSRETLGFVIPSAGQTSEVSSDRSRNLGFCHPERRPNERSEFGQVEGPWVLSSRAPSERAKRVRTSRGTLGFVIPALTRAAAPDVASENLACAARHRA